MGFLVLYLYWWLFLVRCWVTWICIDGLPNDSFQPPKSTIASRQTNPTRESRRRRRKKPPTQAYTAPSCPKDETKNPMLSCLFIWHAVSPPAPDQHRARRSTAQHICGATLKFISFSPREKKRHACNPIPLSTLKRLQHFLQAYYYPGVGVPVCARGGLYFRYTVTPVSYCYWIMRAVIALQRCWVPVGTSW